MNTTQRIKSIAAAAVAGALLMTAPAGASVLDPVNDGWNPGGNDTSTSVTAISHPTGGDSTGAVALRRDGSQATAFVADVSPVTLRRDGSQATTFVADVSPQNPAADDGGFDWGDAAIGAGAGLLTATLLMLGSSAIGRRSGGAPKPGSAVSQGA